MTLGRNSTLFDLRKTWYVRGIECVGFVVSPNWGDGSQSFLIQVEERKKGVLRADVHSSTHGKNFR